MEFEPGSFRDRTGRVFYRGENVYRALTARALAEWEALRGKAFLARGMAEGRIVATGLAGPEVPPPGDPVMKIMGRRSHPRADTLRLLPL